MKIKMVAGGIKGGLTYNLIRDAGPSAAATCMSRVAKFSARWIGNRCVFALLVLYL